MIALKRLKMKRVKNILTTKEEVAKVREALEDKTREAFDRFDKARQACARQWMIACAVMKRATRPLARNRSAV